MKTRVKPPLLEVLFANVQSLDNKLEETRSRMAFQHATKVCNVMVFAETWLGHCSRGALHSPPGPDITTFS